MNDQISPIRPRIVIDQTTGERGKLLQQAFFMATDVEGVYSFYSRQGKIRAANVVSGQDFNFTIDGLNYHVIKFHIEDGLANGEWLIDDFTNEPEGTFQAQSGGGLPTGSEKEESADTRPLNAILIHDDMVFGDPDKDKLKHCYFQPVVPGLVYEFFSKHHNLLQSDLRSGHDWHFHHDSIEWTVTEFVIDDISASGHWSNPDPANEQDGTFQAQSGGMPEGEESASAASA